MSIDDIIAQQKIERRVCLDAILKSTATKKLVVAGPGTGKTYTFGELLQQCGGGNNLAMTFIRKLEQDMERELSQYAEVKTFHAYCKKVLHQLNGRVELVPYLSVLIERDADLLGMNLRNFNTKIRELEEDSPEVAFYLSRGDYYEVVCFDDSVYRLYRLLRGDPDVVPMFTQIVIDEFQDFNPLEVAFIAELEKRGSILIVGDDDQAVYDNRSASSDHLREKYNSGEYAVFTLPFCSRCTDVIVKATNAVIGMAQRRGYLAGRIAKPFECFLGDKQPDSIKYPKIVYANCTMRSVIPKYILAEIAKIAPEDISESRKDGKEYPTVLIIGQKQYLEEVAKQLRPAYPHLSYTPSDEISYNLADAYELLVKDQRSNLGWRILIEFFLPRGLLRKIITQTEHAIPLIDLLNPAFVQVHLRMVEIITAVRSGQALTPDSQAFVTDTLGAHADEVIQHFMPRDEEEVPEIDKTQASIMLTSFVGSKGLSAGHVFIVGLHNEALPKDPRNIADIEISQFVVALTRTRKQCHLISNNWLVSAMQNGKWLPRFTRSEFISWIPNALIDNRGELKAANFQ